MIQFGLASILLSAHLVGSGGIWQSVSCAGISVADAGKRGEHADANIDQSRRERSFGDSAERD